MQKVGKRDSRKAIFAKQSLEQSPHPTSGVTRGPCKAYFHCGLFHVLDMDTDYDCIFFRYTCLDSPILTVDCSVLTPNFDTPFLTINI
jgi:hypothetical protein